MAKNLTKVIATLVLLAGVLVPTRTAFAEEQKASGNALELTPSGTRLTLSPGDVLEGNAEHCPTENEDGCAITVRNIGAAPVRYKVYTSPYAVKGEDNELSFSEEASTAYTQLYKWITIQGTDGNYSSEAEFAVEPGESQVVHYKVTVPDEIPGGSQYAVIWAQLMSNNDGNSGGIETIGQVGAVLTGRSTVDIRETAVLSDYDFTRFAFNGPLHAQVTIENTGNVDFMAHSYYTAKTIFGKEMFTKEIKTPAYPGTTYHVNFDWNDEEDVKVPFLGIFHVEWKVQAADQEKSETHIVVIMPIIVIIVMVLLLTVLIVWTIIIIRKHKERKARKLV